MRIARDVMGPVQATVLRVTPVSEVAALLRDRAMDGVCVVDGDHLVGVVTAMDLIAREKPVHVPAVVVLMDLVIPLEGARRTEADIAKITARTAGELMTTEVTAAAPDTTLTEVAGWMVERHLSMIPVVDGGRLVGVITKHDMLRAAFG